MTNIAREENILNEPLHGIFIPSALYIAGIVILTGMTGNILYLLGIAILAGFIGVRLFFAYSRQQSISSSRWTPLELEDQTIISKNCAIYRFKLNTSFETLDIPIGNHLSVKARINGVDEIRHYTPISSKLDAGYFDIIVKSYVDGKVSKFFAGLKPGNTVNFRGPVGRFKYSPNSSKVIGMIAGGTGITPMLQVLNAIITTPNDFTKVSLIFANETENDILLKDELDEIASKYPNFEVHYILNKPSTSWIGDIGYVSKEHMTKYLPEPSPDNRLLICGTQPMKKMLLLYAKELGWSEGTLKSDPNDQVFVF